MRSFAGMKFSSPTLSVKDLAGYPNIVITTQPNDQSTSRVAVLGVLADLHGEAVQYDLKPLRKLILAIQPDLICAEIKWVDWLSGNLSSGATRHSRNDCAALPSYGYGHHPGWRRGIHGIWGNRGGSFHQGTGDPRPEWLAADFLGVRSTNRPRSTRTLTRCAVI